METLPDLLGRLPERHRRALQWFADRAGQEHEWPKPLLLPEETILASKAKGIYKPSWSKYALSVRESLEGPYPDRTPIIRMNGTWHYSYFQENLDPSRRDSEYTNRALLECWQDCVPIGVMRQTRPKPRVRYRILGVALISNWEGGYFFLEGFSSAGLSHGRGPLAQLESVFARVSAAGADAPESDAVAGRERIVTSIMSRRGPMDLRTQLLEAYGGRCAMSDCDVPEVLETARILPFRGASTMEPSNALLLRSDLHTAFDLGLEGRPERGPADGAGRPAPSERASRMTAPSAGPSGCRTLRIEAGHARKA